MIWVWDNKIEYNVVSEHLTHVYDWWNGRRYKGCAVCWLTGFKKRPHADEIEWNVERKLSISSKDQKCSNCFYDSFGRTSLTDPVKLHIKHSFSIKLRKSIPINKFMIYFRNNIS